MNDVDESVEPSAERGSAAPPSKPPLPAFVESVMLFGDTIIATGWVHDADAPVRITLSTGESEAEAEALRGLRSDVAEHLGDDSAPWGFVALAHTPEGTTLGDTAGVTWQSGEAESKAECVVGPGRLDTVLEKIGPFTRPQRDEVLRALQSRGLALPEPEKPAPRETTSSRRAIDAFVDFATIIDGDGVFLEGWLCDPSGALASLHLRRGEVTSEDILPKLHRFSRADVADADSSTPGASCGMLAFVPVDVTKEPGPIQLVAKMTNGEVTTVDVEVSDVSAHPGAALKALLRHFEPRSPGAVSLLEGELGKAVLSWWRARQRTAFDTKTRDFGVLPDDARFAVVVPIYGRYDFIRHQLCHFSRDEDFERTQLVYVIDDPSIVAEATTLAAECYSLFRLPFRLISPTRNLGYAGASNLGVRHTHGEYVVLLNSDVIPKSAGWLSRLAATHDTLKHPGALAPRLLFHDETIQHDGVAFERRDLFPDLWLNDHPGKGLPKWLAPAADVAEVPAVTGACLMTKRDLYERLEGLDEGYVIGDFEDSDLCLKARELGLRSYVDRREELYHLERQSVSSFGDDEVRLKVTLFNAWLHHEKWDRAIASMPAIGGTA